MTHQHARQAPGMDARLPWYRTWTGLAALAAATAGALYVSLFHVDHLLDALPLALLLLCPVMHLFMHGRHGGHGGSGRPDREGKP